jgi:hypothetical protein
VLAGCLIILAAIALLTAALRFNNSQETHIESFTAARSADSSTLSFSSVAVWQS